MKSLSRKRGVEGLPRHSRLVFGVRRTNGINCLTHCNLLDCRLTQQICGDDKLGRAVDSKTTDEGKKETEASRIDDDFRRGG
jgi:hypothetical protein